jgi:arylsulfatase A-like enzyme
VKTFLPTIALVLGALAPVQARPAPPNFVFILADDLGQRDLGCYGSTFYETPHLDRLAQEGARFTDAYTASPVCSPTRASILTGQWPVRTGITDVIGRTFTPAAWDRNTRLRPAPHANRLSLEAPTLAKALKAAGYATFFAGKWHLGPEGWWPENQGFEINKGGTHLGAPYGGKGYFSPYANPRLPDGPPGEHLSDRLASETTRFIEANKGRPFLAYLAAYDVHTPLMARADLKAKYESKRGRLGLAPVWGREGERDVRQVQEHPVYAAMVEALDLAVGKVLVKLDELGLRENTFVVFTSDNGGVSTGDGWATSNLPLRGGKGWLYEGGLRVPLLMRWPGRIRSGTVVATPTTSTDFFPTLLDAANLAPNPGQPIDGISLLPVLVGSRSGDRALIWHYPHYGNLGGAPAAAIRRGSWKLITWFEKGTIELFDLSTDIGERENLAGREPARVAQLSEELSAWQSRMGAQFPTKNADYDPAKPSGRAALRRPEELSEGPGTKR